MTQNNSYHDDFCFESGLVYYLVFTFRDPEVGSTQNLALELKELCQEIENRFDFSFLEVKVTKEAGHFFLEGHPELSPGFMAQTILKLTNQKLISRLPELKKSLGQKSLWQTDYFMETLDDQEYEKALANLLKTP
ncbi:MAG: transposase [Deltaproteobacteria bacterium]|jgi:REP element-mobilizing transposase RayT|nr:transposase [Deltaproteobacteria bacterium]